MRILTIFIATMLLLAGCGQADQGGEAAMEQPMEETMTEAPAAAAPADEGMMETETPQWAQLEQNVVTPGQ